MHMSLQLIQLVGQVHHCELALQPVSHDEHLYCQALAPALLNQRAGAAMGAAKCAGLTIIGAIFAGCALSAPPFSSPSDPSVSTIASGFHDRTLAPRDT